MFGMSLSGIQVCTWWSCRGQIPSYGFWFSGVQVCTWSFTNIEAFASVAEDVACQAEVVDLLVCFTTIACASARSNVIFTPYPLVVGPKQRKGEPPVIDPKRKDCNFVSSILVCIRVHRCK